jgi:pyruvate dehydrogenase E2 component (dihydrolipoamide acetyltransferase)
MDFEMKMPDLATTGSPIKVVRWLATVGQTVRRGETLLEVETDKAVLQVESVFSGRLISISAREGDEVEAGQAIAVFQTDRAGPAIVVAEARSTPSVASTDLPAPLAREASPAVAGGRKSIFARNREARARGGRAAALHEPGAPKRSLALTVPQKVLAHRMVQSKQTIPHFYLKTSANAEAMMARREAVVGEPIAWDAFFVHAAGEALRAFERFAYRFEDDRLIHRGIDSVGLAVDVHGELFTLAIEQPASKTLETISREIAEGAARLRSGDPQARMVRPACLTVSNLGGANVESFAAVINPPESAILAVGTVMPVVTVVDGQVAVQNRVNLTLSVDHRVASGKYAAEFLGMIVREIQTL